MALRRCGALWLKEGKKGKFMSGVFEPEGKGGPRFDLLVFKNTKKDRPKDPDYTIQLREADEPSERSEEGGGGEQPPF